MIRLAAPHVFIRWIPLAGIGLALFFYGQFLYLHAMNIPFADDILDVLQVMSGLIGADQPGQSLELLFAQHNDHRTTSSRLLYYLSYAAEGEINFRTLTFVANFALIMILLVMYLAIRDHFAPWLLLLPAALVLFQLRAYGLTLWSMAAFAYFYVYLYGFACLLMLRNINGVRFIFAILLASLATFTLASGQMIWLVGVVSLLQQVAIRKKVPLSYVAVWLGAAIAVMLAWRVGLETPNTLLYVLDFFIQKPWYQLTYYFVLLGNAVTEESVTVAATAGGLMFLLLCYSTFRNRRAGNILPELFGWYIVFSVIAMTLGRAPYSDIEYALSSRYSFPSVLMLANSCIVVFYRLDRRYLKLFLLPIFLASVYCVSSYTVYAEKLQSAVEKRVQNYNRKNYWVFGKTRKETNPIVRRAVSQKIYVPPSRPYPQPTIFPQPNAPKSASQSADAREEKRPNILLIMVDDLGFNDLAINNNNSAISTPNLDELAQQGVRFTRHYAKSVCSPARAALLSGQYPERNGYMSDGRGLSEQLTTLPDALKAAGYATWHIGKWHIGDLQRRAWPDYQGFDHWFGFLNQWRLAGKRRNGELELIKPRYLNPWLEGDSEPGAFYKGHLENILTDKTLAVLADLDKADAPWFINLWFYAPHTPIQPAAQFAKLYPDSDAGRYRALVHQLDHNIGRILDRLDHSGQRDNTIVVVVSDNGGTNRQFDNNFPYFGRKTMLNEGGLRTPLIIQWPASATAGTVYNEVISTEDIYPTLLESIGLDRPSELDGRSLYKAIQQPQKKRPGRTLFWESGPSNYGLLSANGRWRLFQPWTYTVEPPPPLLYDLDLAPSGELEVSPSPARRVETLLKEMWSWRRDVHQVKTTYKATTAGVGTLTGMDFLRTPGFGGYTFGVGFSGEIQGNLVKQENIWQMNIDDSVVHLAFGDIELQGVIDTDKNCHSAVVSGFFAHHLSSFGGPTTSRVSLYIDGQHRQTVEVDRAIEVEDITMPMVLGSAGILAGSAQIYKPVILNVPIESSAGWTLDSLGDELCPAPERLR